MQHLLPLVDEANCTGCVACVDACTHLCFEMRGGVAVLTNPEACSNDRNCVTACPTDAIELRPSAPE
jgi:NAD-dependent dihydropyrimidine dehydrogenase PreA subunit